MRPPRLVWRGSPGRMDPIGRRRCSTEAQWPPARPLPLGEGQGEGVRWAGRPPASTSSLADQSPPPPPPARPARPGRPRPSPPRGAPASARAPPRRRSPRLGVQVERVAAQPSLLALQLQVGPPDQLLRRPAAAARSSRTAASAPACRSRSGSGSRRAARPRPEPDQVVERRQERRRGGAASRSEPSSARRQRVGRGCASPRRRARRPRHSRRARSSTGRQACASCSR